MSEIILEAVHLSKTFRNHGSDTKAVCDVSFKMQQGEILGITGESGSGKTTIAQLISGLLMPDQGKVFYKHACISDLKERKKYAGKIQIVFQNPYSSFDPRRTLGYSIGESMINRGASEKETQERVRKLLKECLLPEEYCLKYPDEVSGGECQRAAIARALSSDPEILICDEAVSSLDGPSAQQILQLCRKLRKERKLSILFISHNVAMMQNLCERLIIMKEGKIIEEGETEKILSLPSSSYAKELIAASR